MWLCVCLSSGYWKVLYWIDASVLHPLCSRCGDDGRPVVIVLTFISFLIVVAVVAPLLCCCCRCSRCCCCGYSLGTRWGFWFGFLCVSSVSLRALCVACQSSFHFTVTQIFISFSFSLIFSLGLRQRVLRSAYGCFPPLSLSLSFCLTTMLSCVSLPLSASLTCLL